MAVSLQIILLSMILVVAIVAAAVSFAPLFTASSTNAENQGRDYSLSISTQIVQSVEKYFGRMQNTATQMVAGAKLGGWALDDTNGIMNWMNYGVTLGADSINMIFDQPTMWTAGFVTPSNVAVPDGQVVMVRYNGSHAHSYVLHMSNLSQVSFTITSNTLNFRQRQYFTVIRQTQGWGNPLVGVSLGISEAVLPCGAPIVMPNGTSVGAFYVRTRAAIIVDYFRTLQVAQTGRAMLVDPRTNNFVASNSPLDPLLATVNGVVSVANYTHVRDPLLVRVTAALGSRIMTCTPLPCVLSVGSGDSMVFVTVAGVNDSFNLNKRLVVAIPSDDFLGKIRAASKTSLGAAAGSVTALLVMSLIAVLLITRPLQRLEAKIYASATLEDDDTEDGGMSMIKEIRNIEEAYNRLQAELKKVKSFLPQSVLKQLEQQDEQDDDDDEGGLNESVAVTEVASSRKNDVRSFKTHHTNNTNISRTSHLSSEDRRKALDAGRALNTSMSVASRNCTVVMANFDRFHDLAQSSGRMTTMHTAVMTLFMSELNATKGVLDSFHGDRFMATFNASTNCASHHTKAAMFIVRVLDELHAANICDFKGLRFGAASGKALCGNLGTSSVKRFCVIGPSVNHACALLAHCRSFPDVDNLVSAESIKGMSFEYNCDLVTLCVLPHASDGTLVGTVTGKKSAKMDEWMYELQESDQARESMTGDASKDSVTVAGRVLQHLFAGRLAEAQAVLAAPAASELLRMPRVAHVAQLISLRASGQSLPVLGKC